jgi:alcohol dehydrogenase, propanol-preferring
MARGRPTGTGRPSPMRAMVLRQPGPASSQPLHLEEMPTPEPGPHEVRVRVDVCGVCRTDLHVVEGDLPPVRDAVIPGHEIVGRIERVGAEIRTLAVGDRVGVPWLHRTCGRCEYCVSGRENLCERKEFTGYSVNGGYATEVLGDEGYVFRLPAGDAPRWAPFLCAGIIGYRAFKLALPRPGGRIGFFGFGGSAHLTMQLAARQGYATVAYSRDEAHLDLARRLGVVEGVLTDERSLAGRSPSLDAAIVFAPAGEVVLQALRELKKGATVSIAAIHMSPIPTLDYDRWLFGERRLVSVEANTRADAREFLDLADRLKLESTVQVRPLAQANAALDDLRNDRIVGAAVLDCAGA